MHMHESTSSSVDELNELTNAFSHSFVNDNDDSKMVNVHIISSDE
jgi:hypothetical protein